MRINERWEILSDEYNYTLREHHTTSKGTAVYKDRYFVTLEQALQWIITQEGKGVGTLPEAIHSIRRGRDDILSRFKTCERKAL